MKNFFINILFILLPVLFITGCRETPVNNTIQQDETLLFEKAGLVDSIAGTCSAYIVRTIILDSIDTRNYNSIRIDMTSFTDGDLSNITLYYLKDTAVNLFSIDGLNRINNTSSITLPSPLIKSSLYLRMRLYASVCTGQYYHLKMHNFRIYGIK
jgi:hypothetical protein